MAGEFREMMRLLGDFSTVGLTLAFSIFIGVGFGYFLDQKVFDGATHPWFTLIFLGLGIVAGFKNLYIMARRKDL